jgi:serine O-acetyltransferase
MLKTLHEDLQAVFSRDPAARSTFEVMLCYPGLHAVWGYRVAHWLWRHDMKLLGRWLSQLVRFLTGIEIHPGAQISKSFFIDHGMGVVIGETAEVGNNVTLYHGVTLGGVSLEKGKRHPTLEDNVVVGAGAKVLGNIVIGSGSRIGANAVVVKSVPPNSVVVGVPGQVVVRSQQAEAVDLHHDRLPDTLGAALASVMSRLETVESSLKVYALERSPAAVHGNGNGSAKSSGNGHGNGNGNGNGHEKAPQLVHAPDHGVWHGEDFMI